MILKNHTNFFRKRFLFFLWIIDIWNICWFIELFIDSLMYLLNTFACECVFGFASDNINKIKSLEIHCHFAELCYTSGEK